VASEGIRANNSCVAAVGRFNNIYEQKTCHPEIGNPRTRGERRECRCLRVSTIPLVTFVAGLGYIVLKQP
jgi:hypothetical protein